MLKNRLLLYITLGAFIYSCFIACNRNKYVMPKSKMEEVLYDIQLAHAVYGSHSPGYWTNDRKEELLNGIFEKHNINQQILDSSLVWYSEDVTSYLRITDSVFARLKRDHAIYEKELQVIQQRNGRLAITDFPPYFYLTPESPTYAFNLDSVKLKTWEISSVHNLSFDILGDSSGVYLQKHAYFQFVDSAGVKYDTTFAFTHTMPIIQFPDRRLVNMSGYIHAQSAVPSYRILLYNIKLNRDSLSTFRQPEIKPVALPSQNIPLPANVGIMPSGTHVQPMKMEEAIELIDELKAMQVEENK